MAFVLVFYQVLLQVIPLTGVKVLGYAADIPPSEVVSLTNQKRAEAGLSELSVNPVLSQAAKAKGEHMLANDYWAHTAPDGTEPWAFFTNSGYRYRYAGENLARDFTNPTSVVEAWMASPTHRDNLLSNRYDEIGIGVVEGDLNGVDTTIIVQFLGTRIAGTETEASIAQAETEAETTPTPAPTREPTLTPTPTQEVSPTPTEAQLAPVAETQEPGGFQVLFSPFDTTRGVSLAVVILLLAVMVIDGIVVHRRKITRVGGRTFAHLAFLGMILAIVLIARAGQIL